MKEIKDIYNSKENITTSFKNEFTTMRDLPAAETLKVLPPNPAFPQPTILAQTLETASQPEPETQLLPNDPTSAYRNTQVEQTYSLLNNAQTQLLTDQETRGVDPADPSSRLHKVVGKYEYIDEIARGGMGRIVSVRDRSLRRKVAMKLLIAPNGKPTSSQIDRLLAEAQTTGQLEHPNIVPIHDVGVNQSDNYYFTMKLVKGTTLKEVFRKLTNADTQTSEQYSLHRMLAIFQQIANGLGFAHSRGVIHRDLKPDNIMIGEFGEVLIMDWGIAKLVKPMPSSGVGAKNVEDHSFAHEFKGIETLEKDGTVVGTIAGTVGYMSPEQARGEVDRLDARTDIFSLGALLYEMLAGSPPYNQPTIKERLFSAAHEEAIEGPAVRARKMKSNLTISIPREVAAIAMKAVALKPDDRYQSAQEFVDDIQRYLEGHSVTACPDTLVQQVTKWTKRNRVMVRTVAAVVCAVVLAAWGARFLIRHSMIAGHKSEGQRVFTAAQTEREKGVQLVPKSNSVDDGYADLNRQRELDSLDEKYSGQLSQAANFYSRVFDYDPTNAEARSELAKIYMEMWRSAQRRNKPELMNAYALEVARFAGPDDYKRIYEAEINGDGQFKLITGDVRAEVFIFRNVETGKWARLTPAPYRFAERKVDDEALAEAASRLRTSADGHGGESVYFLNMDPKFGHDLGQTPLTVERMPVGSYVLVLRAPGYEERHLPVTLARQKNLELNVRMLRTGERPVGFSYIPSVWAKVGGPAAGTKWANYTWKAVNPFFIQTFEVTFGEYEKFLQDLIASGQVAEAKQHLPRDFGFYYLEIVGRHLKPHSSLTEGWRKWAIRGVSWLDAQSYAEWRSRKEGVTYRLPSELEWEVAARGTDGRRYTWGEAFWPQATRLSQGYTSANNTGKTGQFADESVFGVWDMTGGQAEWCADEFGGRSGERALRGNAWALQPVGLETAFRTSGPPDYFHSTTGFRLATNLR